MLWQNRWRGMHTNLVDAKDHKNKEYMSWSKSTMDTMKNKFGGCHWGSKSQDHALVKELDDRITTMPWAKSMLAIHDICCAHLLWKLSSLRVFFSSLYHGQRPRPRIQIIGCQRPKIQRPQSCDKKNQCVALWYSTTGSWLLAAISWSWHPPNSPYRPKTTGLLETCTWM